MSYEGQTYYLGYDQVGTLRTVASQDGTMVKSVEHDTFGNVLSDSNPVFKVPFGFAGGLYDPDTKLTRFGYRDYDAETGKWTAKDPIGFEGGDTNLYGYVLGDPVDFIDPEGLIYIPDPNGIVPGGPWIPNPKNKVGNYLGPKMPDGGRAQCQYVPSQYNGGPKGAEYPYWKVNNSGQKGWQRYNMNGKPITAEQAHSGTKNSSKLKMPGWWLLFAPTDAN